MYASDLDASMIDLFDNALSSPRASLALSAAQLSGKLERKQSCKIGTFLGDPEDPLCARLVLSGVATKLASGTSAEKVGKAALFAKHPSFADYPPAHDFFVVKLELDGIWLINIFGGAANISPADYFKAKA